MLLTVFARRRGFVCVQVMAVVMVIGMFTFQHLMVVGVAMRFRKMKYDAGHHGHASHGHHPGGSTVALPK